MKVLIDTHTFLWWNTEDPQLSALVKGIIADGQNDIFLSAASVWEIAIKHALGRGDMPVSSQDAVRYFRESGYRFLAIEAEHAMAVEDLAAHHQDPFDRILIAQALTEPMRLLSRDATVAAYGEMVLAV